MKYRLAQMFAVRPTGVPFEVLESLATPGVNVAARALAARRDALSEVVVAAAEAVNGCAALSFGQRQRLRRKIFKRVPIAHEAAELAELASYRRMLDETVEAERHLQEVLGLEYEASRRRIYEHAEAQLPDLAVIQLTSAALQRMLETRTFKDDRSLAIWLQRVCAKNDTISRFGPSCWGSVDAGESGVRIAPDPGISRRVAWIERWVVHAIIAAINRDPEIRDEVAPRLHPNCELRETEVWWHDTGAKRELTVADHELLAQCDGRTPAYQIGARDGLARLADDRVVIWTLEPMFQDQSPLATLAADVAGWRDGPARKTWSEKLAWFAAVAVEYAEAIEASHRQAILERVHGLLASLGIAERQRTGRLYEASNPIVENCCRSGEFVIGQRRVDELVADATPWFDLFRDANSVAALAVYDGLSQMHAKAPRHHGRLSLSAFMAFAAASGSDLQGSIFRFAHETFREIRDRFARRLSRPDAPEWELTPEDCSFLAGSHVPRKDLAYLSADLQIAAPSLDAVARGDFQWVVSELHHGVAIMGQSLTWSCPDRSRLGAQLRDCQGRQPTFYFDSMGATHAPVHISPESVLDSLESVSVASTWRSKPHWTAYAPSDVDIVLDEENRDVRARCVSTGANLGSLFPLPRFALHPFFPLQLEHTPRLRRGRTVLQRRSWMISAEELGGPFGELSGELVSAVERMRARRDLPRWVFLRLREDELSGVDDKNRLKDVKPLCIDLESYVLIEVFARRLEKYGKVELAEMLPAPNQLVWQETDGRRCFELRTLLVPDP